MAAKKILMLIGDYAEDYKTMVPLQVPQMIGRQVHAVCPSKQVGQSVRTAIHDFEGDRTYSEKPGRSFTPNADFAQARAKDYDILLISDDRAPEYLRLNEQVLALVRAFDTAREPIVTVCHDAQLPAAAGILQERTCSAYPTCAPEVRLAGDKHVDIPSDQAHADGHLVTTPTWLAHPAWLARFLEVLGTRINH